MTARRSILSTTESKKQRASSSYHLLGNKDGKLFNAATFVVAKIVKAVMSLAAGIEYDGLYMSAKEVIGKYTNVRTTLSL